MVEFIRAWIIGAVVWFMLTNAGALAFRLLAPAEHAGTFTGALLWLGGIGFAAYFLSVVAAALVHRPPDRHSLGRNAVAVLAAPAVGTAVDTGRLLAGSGVNGALYASWTAVALAGAALAFVLMRRLQAPTVVESATGKRVRVARTYWDRTERSGAGEQNGGRDAEGAGSRTPETPEAPEASGSQESGSQESEATGSS
ncbi:hypothetical protein [Streptomonospora salina]|uniref:Putative membrane protein n=1 Tax=Streptomonospora salina TaxID=104205 RepID=A0A841E0N7_9ACTN|nr:hypothetical protein [Streptomonospora salina]MBB5997317.1 putative membrane protein [Streptomonospora salina]